MGIRIKPFVFTELGVAMLSSILNSAQAIAVSISIMRIFAKLRSFLLLEKGDEEEIYWPVKTAKPFCVKKSSYVEAIPDKKFCE